MLESSTSVDQNDLFISNQGKLATDWETRSQFRRAAVSTMNNIAEGFARYHQKDFIRFLEISQSSAAEVKSMLYLLEDIGYLDKPLLQELHHQTDKLRKLTLGLIRYLNENTTSPHQNTLTQKHKKMARRTASAPPEPDLPKRRSPFQLLLIGIGLFILLSIALQTCGVHILSRSDEEKLIDRPHSGDRQEREVPEDLEVEEE